MSISGIVRVCCAILLLLGISSFTVVTNNESKMVITIEHFVGKELLGLDTVSYKNELGQPYTITKFKYYISNIRLMKEGGTDETFPGYFLVNEDEEMSNRITLEPLPTGRYTGIEFIIGVDSLHNCSGAQSGALDPINAMFWAWNTGYIFLKLEGKSSVSKSPGHIFEYHIGGYKDPVNCLRQVQLKFSKPFVAGTNKEIHLKADIAEILKNPTTIDFSVLSSVTDAKNATTIANNYSDMFSVTDIK